MKKKNIKCLSKIWKLDEEYKLPTDPSIEEIDMYLEKIKIVTAHDLNKAAVENDYSYGMAYHDKAQEIADIVVSKQEAYGNSFSKSCEVMKILYPNGIPVDKFNDALTVLRIVDKLFRIATDKDAFGEDPFLDVTGYGLLAVVRNNKNKEKS